MVTKKKGILTMNEQLLSDLKNMHETLWINPKRSSNIKAALENSPLKLSDIEDAQKRLKRFAPLIKAAFKDTESTGGIIESPLVRAKGIEKLFKVDNIYLKLDSHLPISGSIKARGGIYEVLKHAEDLALENGLLKLTDDYSILLDDAHRSFFSKYSIAVGSTGNLGLSIGICAAKLGFKVTVHMSCDAKEWKKALLREKGCTVCEYKSDYSIAVKEGRERAAGDATCYFIDDENSQTLFLGYAVAGLRLKEQLLNAGVVVDSEHPLYVYLPCGVGGGPGGVAFGIMNMFENYAHCFFAEPTHSPCMLLGMASNMHNNISVGDIGLDNKTAADGLAVGRASGFVGKIMQPLISGAFTVCDERMFAMLAQTFKHEHIALEPSALCGMYGVQLMKNIKNATHIVWATGGNMVPQNIMNEYIRFGEEILEKGKVP